MEAGNRNIPPEITHGDPDYAEFEGSGHLEAGTSSGTAAGDPSAQDRWDGVRRGFHSNWQRRYGTAGRRWEDYEPAYRYGWERSRVPEYQGRSWAEVEPELRSGWEQRHYVSPWERIADAVKDAWEGLAGGDEGTEADRAA